MTEANGSKRWLTIVGLVVILMATFLAYANCLDNDFTYDDRAYVKVSDRTADEDNVMVRVLHPWTDYFKKPYGQGIHQSRGYRPATVLSFAWTHHLFRRQVESDTATRPEFAGYQDRDDQRFYTDPPWPHHLLNVVLHVLSTALVFLLGRRIAGPGPSLWAAAFFGLHALHSDPVISIVGRAEILGFLFGAAATLLIATDSSRPGPRAWLRLAVAAICLFLAFSSKESAVAWFGFVPLFLFVRRQLGRGPAAWCRPHLLVVLLPPLLLFLWLRHQAIAPNVESFDVAYESNKLYDLGFWQRLPTAGVIYLYALGKLFWPWPLSADYGGAVFQLRESMADPRFLMAALSLALVLVAGLSQWRRRPLLFLTVATFFGFSFLVTNVPLAIETIYGERLYYSAVLAVCVAVGFVAERLPRFGLRVTATAVALSLLGAHLWMIQTRCVEWQDNHTLFWADAGRMPLSSSMNLNVAGLCREAAEAGDESKWVEFRRRIDHVMANDPESALPYNELGLYYLNQADYAESARWFRRAMEVRHFEPERDGVQLNMNLARLFSESGDIERERQALEAALGSRPDCAPAIDQLLWVAFLRDDRHLYQEVLRRGKEQFPSVKTPDGGERHHAPFVLHQGLWAYRDGDYASAARFLGESLRALPPQPRQLEAYVRCISAYIRLGRKNDAAQMLVDVEYMLLHAKLGKAYKAKLQERYRWQIQKLRKELTA